MNDGNHCFVNRFNCKVIVLTEKLFVLLLLTLCVETSLTKMMTACSHMQINRLSCALAAGG